MADSDIDQDFQLCQVLQRRHLFEKPVEFLVKVRCKDGRLREIWLPKSTVVSSSFGRGLLKKFNKTKVGERGIDMYIGKRRSLSEKLKSNSGIAKDSPSNDFNVNCNNVTNSSSNSWQLIKASTSSKSVSDNSKGIRKVKTRASISRKRLASSNSRINKISVRRGVPTQNAKQITRLALVKKSKKSSSRVVTQEQLINSASSRISTKLSKQGSKTKCSQRPQKVTQSHVQETSGKDVHPSKELKIQIAHLDEESKNKICHLCSSTCQTRQSSVSGSSSLYGSCHDLPTSTYCNKCLQTHSSTCCHVPISDRTAEAISLGRRASIRQTESAYRLKEVTVRKFSGFVHLIFGSETSNKKILKNSFDPKVFQEISMVLRNLAHDDCKVVLISGSGNTFSSGINLAYLLESEQDRKTAAKNMAEALREFVNLLITFPKPVVAAVNGVAAGLGTAMLPLCDIVYASDKASFFCPYTSLAQTPEACSSHTFPNIMGPAMANEMLLRGRKITALEAHQIGLITQVFWPENLMGEVIPRVQNLAQQSPKGMEYTKALIRGQGKSTLESVNQNECKLLVERWSSSECQKAIRVFLDRQINSV